MRFGDAKFRGLDPLITFAHFCDVNVGLGQNVLHILEFNVVSGSILLNCRNSFCCTVIVDPEWETVKVLCFNNVVDSVDRWL